MIGGAPPPRRAEVEEAERQERALKRGREDAAEDLRVDGLSSIRSEFVQSSAELHYEHHVGTATILVHAL